MRRAAAMAEAWAGLVAVALSVLVVAALTPRHAFEFFDSGDSMLPAIMANSIRHGGPQHWDLSAVLFAPEIAQYLPLSLLGLSVSATLALAGVVNLVLFYLCLRMVAAGLGRTGPWSALLGFAAFGVVCACETLSKMLASEFVLMTHYSGTVLGIMLALGLALMWQRRRTSWIGGLYLLTTAGSTMTNPLFVMWFGAAVVIVMLAVATWRRCGWYLVAALATSAAIVVGFLVRPLLPVHLKATDTYFNPRQWRHAAGYLVRFFVDQISILLVIQGLIVAVCMVILVASILRAVRSSDGDRAFVAAVLLVAAVGSVVGTVVSGNAVARYIQPLFFLAPVALLMIRWPTDGFSPAWLPRRWAPAVAARIGGVGLLVLAVVGAVGIGRDADAAEASMSCAVNWVDQHPDQIGAGEYWQVRAIKARISDQAWILQLSSNRKPFEWLVNSADYSQPAYSYVITTEGTSPFVPPAGSSRPRAVAIACGAYTIEDYFPDQVPVDFVNVVIP